MSDFIYTKSSLQSRIAKGMGADLNEAATIELNQHLRLKHPNADPVEFAATFVRAVIIENDFWSREADIESELRDFLLAIRKGNVDLKGANAVAYADAHRQWKRDQQAHDRYEPTPSIMRADLPTDINAANYAAEFEQCYEGVVMLGDQIETWVQKKRCLRDLLEGIEQHLNDHKQAGTRSEFDDYFRRRYNQGRQLWLRLTGKEWEILQPRTTNLQTGRAWGRRALAT